jgi:hypothetical protein
LINFGFKDVGAAVVGGMESNFGRAIRIMAKNVEKLIFGGLHEKHAVQRGIWVPTLDATTSKGEETHGLPGGAPEGGSDCDSSMPVRTHFRRSSNKEPE